MGTNYFILCVCLSLCYCPTLVIEFMATSQVMKLWSLVMWVNMGVLLLLMGTAQVTLG